MTPKKVALVGAGQMGSNHARTVSTSEHFELSYVIDSDIDRARLLANTYGAQALESIAGVSQIDAAIVATSTHSHFDIVVALLRESVPVLCEKPLTGQFELTELLITEARKRDLIIQCGFVERFNPAFLAARRLIQEPVLYAQATRHSPPAIRIASGVAEDLLIHDIDLALSLVNFESVSVVGRGYTSNTTGFSEISDCILSVDGSAIFNLSASRMSQRKIREWRISTANELIEVDLLRQTVAIYENISQEVGSGGGASYRARTTIDYPFIERSGEPLALQLQHFAGLLYEQNDAEAERESILRSHQVLAEFMKVCTNG